MTNNKILIELEIPLIEKKYDLFIPINKKIGTIKSLIEEALVGLSSNAYFPKDDSNFYSKETGEIYDVNKEYGFNLYHFLFLSHSNLYTKSKMEE